MKTSTNNTCQSKTKFSCKTAWRVARQARKDGCYLKAYKCPACHRWHLAKCDPIERTMMAFKELEAAG